MTTAQRTQKLRERVIYPPGQLPWKGRVMFAPMAGIPDLSYRGQKPAAALRN